MSISTFGWATLVTHLDTIAGSLPTNSAKRLLVMFFSAKTTFRRFKRFRPVQMKIAVNFS